MTSAARALPSPRALSAQSRRGLHPGMPRNATECGFGNITRDRPSQAAIEWDTSILETESREERCPTGSRTSPYHSTMRQKALVGLTEAVQAKD